MLSPAPLSLASSFQRGWGSVYDALVDGQIDDKAVETLLSQHPLEAGEPIYAVDASVWTRSMPKPVPNALFTIIRPVTRLGNRLSQAGSTIGLGRLSFAHDSWTAPRKIRRLKPEDLVNLVAVEQIKELLQSYPDSAPLPIFVFDAGYEPGQLAQAWGSLRATALTRLRAGRCFYADPSD